MIHKLTRSEAQQIIDAMCVEVTLPVSPDLDWFAFYGGDNFPRGVVFSHYASNEDGLMGIIARPHVDLPVRPKVEEPVKNTQPAPKRLTIVLPKRYCINCGVQIPHDHKYQTCNYRCHQAYQAKLASEDVVVGPSEPF